MTLVSWLTKSRSPERGSSEKQAEKKALQAELAQSVVTFERKRHTLQQIAEKALENMKEGHS